MARINHLEGIDYSGSDAHLRDALFVRSLHIPMDEKNKLIRKHAIILLQEWEDKNESNRPQRMGKVIFHRSTNPSAGPFVWASVNEKVIVAPYEKEVILSENMIRECIDRATTVYRIPKSNAAGEWVSEASYSPVFPYTLIEWIDPKEVDTETATENE